MFYSSKGSIGFISQTACPLGTFANRFLQQKRNETNIQRLLKLNHMLKQQQLRWSPNSFKSTTNTGKHSLYVLYSANGDRPIEHGQTGYIDGLIIHDIQNGSIFHIVDQNSHPSRRPLKYSANIETLAVG